MTGKGKIHLTPIVTATLSLLAFMLAIVFGVAESRVSELKHVVLDEAIAIGTTYARVDLLPKADRAEIRQLLNEYVTLRVEIAQIGTRQQALQAASRSEAQQNDLWYRAITIANQQPTPISALFVESLNELIDMHQKTFTLRIHYRLPGIIWIVLYGLAILAMAMGGYDTGASGSRRLIAITLSAALAFSVVLVLIVALDRAEQHLLAVTQLAMEDLQEVIRRSMQSRP